MAQLIAILVLFVAAAVLVTIEVRIMRKPASLRTEREKRFIASDRKFGRAYKSVATRVAPILIVVLSVFLLAVTIPFFRRGDVAIAVTCTVIAAIGFAGAVLLWRVVARQRTPDWQARQDAAQSAADEGGHPRFFVSGRAGIAVGAMFTAFGVILLVLQSVLGGPLVDLVLPALILLVGILALVAANAQRRSEGSR